MNARDVRASLYRWLIKQSITLGYSDIEISPGVAAIPKDRPAFVVEATPSVGGERYGRMLTLLEHRFNIMILTGPEGGPLEAERWNSQLQNRLISNNWRIPGILYDFRYPIPELRERVGEGNLGIDTYYVAVNGLSFMDESEETLPCLTQSLLTTEADAQLDIIIPRFPRSFNFFRKYNVWAGTDPEVLKLTADSPITAEVENISTLKTLDDMPSGVTLDEADSSEVRYRIMTVDPESFSHSVQAEPSGEAGLWMGLITISITVAHEPIISQTYPIESVTMEIPDWTPDP